MPRKGKKQGRNEEMKKDTEHIVKNIQPEVITQEVKESLKRPDEKELTEAEKEISPEEQVRLLTNEVELYKDRWLRTRAEWENFRKRTLKEKAEWITNANEDLILEIADVLDNFELALVAGKDHKDYPSFYKGIEMIYEQLMNLLKKRGLTEIETVGKEFDPRYHEAVANIESDKYEENIVADKIQTGYILNNKVIRHAKVAVSKGKKNSTNNSTQKDAD